MVPGKFFIILWYEVPYYLVKNHEPIRQYCRFKYLMVRGISDVL